MEKQLQKLLLIMMSLLLCANLNFSQDQKLSRVIPKAINYMMQAGIEIDFTAAKLNPQEFIDGILNFYKSNNIKQTDEIMSLKMLECLGEDWENSAWVYDYKELTSYNANLNVSQTLTLLWENNNWVNAGRWSYAYNANAQVTNVLMENWENSQWVNETQWLRSYDANGNETVFEWQVWENNSWVGFMKNLYTYDSNNLMTQEIMQMWESGAYADFTRTTYTYNANNYIIESVMEMFLGFWMNSTKEIYTQDASGNNTEIIIQTWNMMTNTWENDSRDLYTFNASNMMSEIIFQMWDGSSWQNDLRFLNQYTNNQISLTQTFHWDGSGWQNDSQTINTYDSQNYLTESLNQNWDGGTWVNVGRYTYTWGQPTTGAEDNLVTPAVFSLKQNYPNPFNPLTNIEFSIKAQSNVTLKIYDALGESVSILLSEELYPGQYKIQFNAENLASGLYICRLTSNQYTLIRKMMLLK